MSGNVSQMVELLDMCLKAMHGDISSGTVMHASINAINAVHKVYTGMQVGTCTVHNCSNMKG